MAAGCLILLGGMDSPGFAYSPQAPLRIIDSAQNELQITEKPVRVVSLVPYITEMLVAFGQEDVLAGLTREDLALNSGLRKKTWAAIFLPTSMWLAPAGRI